MNHEERGFGAFESLGIAWHRGVVDLKEIGTDIAETCTVKEAIEHPRAEAKLH